MTAAAVGLSTYPIYAMGGGYVISGDVVQTLVDVNRKLRLKFTPIEDATLGFWLMSMDLRHIDHRKFYTWAAPCCFKAPVRREGQRIITRLVTCLCNIHSIQAIRVAVSLAVHVQPCLHMSTLLVG